MRRQLRELVAPPASRHQLVDYQPPAETAWNPIYQDDDLLVVDKPSGLLSVPGRGAHVQDCLIARVQRHCPDALIVHRLDMDTSGLVLLARGPAMQKKLSALFMNRQVGKRYEAIVHGQVASNQGQIDLPLITDWPNRPRQKVDHIDGKPSQTRYVVLARWVTNEQHFSRLSLTPVTGRTHQLRVHCQQMGHPIVGDPLYSLSDTDDKKAQGMRLMLHALELSFAHPVSGLQVTLMSPCQF
jgi:tRNA pseudouridine32 synthase / 23S rRNA pseudouridine746 synthase